MRKNYADVFGATILALFLAAAWAVVVFDKYNEVTCLVFVAPGLVSSACSLAKTNHRELFFMYVLVCFMMMLAGTCAVVASGFHGILEDGFEVLLAGYPMYQMGYAVHMRKLVDKEMEMKNRTIIKLGQIRPFFDKTGKVSICMAETLRYENYKYIKDVPHYYDNYYVYGFGIIESEFRDPVTNEMDYFTYEKFMLKKV